MKKYVKQAVKELLESDKLKLTIDLQKPNDYRKNFLWIWYNKLLLWAQTRIVPSHIKNFLLRTTGMKVGHDVCVPHYIKFDPYFPELINLGKGSLVGGDTTFIAHQVAGNKLTLGKIILKERTINGGMCQLFPGSVIEKNSILGFFSDLKGILPAGELWMGRPAKQIVKFSPEQIDKFFKPSNGQYKEYYKSFKKQVREFLKDSNKHYLKVHYDGKRLNAGNDWYKARNFFRIWYNGVIIELTTFLPHCFLKTWMLKAVGVKMGKRCKIGKRVVFDHLFCDLVTLGDDVVIEDDVYFDGHEYTITQTVFGKINVGNKVHFKKGCFVRAAAQIGENVTFEEDSFIEREIPPNTVCAGNPAKPIKEKK